MTHEDAFEDETGAADDEQTLAGSAGNETDGDAADVEDPPVALGVKLGSAWTVVSHPDGEDPDGETIEEVTSVPRTRTGQPGLTSGLPANEASAANAREFLDGLAAANDVPDDGVVVYAIPTTEDETGLANLREIVEESALGGRTVRSYPESLCSALPAFGDDLEAIEQTFVAVNMGATHLTTSIYRQGEQLAPFTTDAATGDDVDRRIADGIRIETNEMVDLDVETAREYKERLADYERDVFEPETFEGADDEEYEVALGRSVMNAVDRYLAAAVDELANTFFPRVANDHMRLYNEALDSPIVLTGGMAAVPGIETEFAERLSESFGRDVRVTKPADPKRAAAVGAERLAERLASLQTA